MSIHDTDFSRRLRSSATPASPQSLRSNHPEDASRPPHPIYEADYTRRLRSSHTHTPYVPPSPVSLGVRGTKRGGSGVAGAGDVFGDITAPVRNGSPRGGSPGVSMLGRSGSGSGGKGKGVIKDYGDRFIPTRDGTDLHAAYQFMNEVDPVTGREVVKTKNRRKSGHGVGTDQDTRRDEVNATFTQVLRNELFPSLSSPSRTNSPSQRKQISPVRRPVFNPSTSHNTSPFPVSNAGTTPLHHHPPPALSGERDRTNERELSPASTLPPLPMHAPATPTSHNARPPGAGPSSQHHRAHQSQVALTSATRTTPPNSTGRKSAFSPPPSGVNSPSTPSKKRFLNFASPTAVRLGAVGVGLDDMSHEKYSLSPVGKESQRMLLSPRKGVRQIARTPFKVLDAPELADDFYLNLVSWSAGNVLGVGLNSCVYLWSAQTSKVTKLCDMTSSTDAGEEVGDAITGLEWTNRGNTLAIGTNRGSIEIWDAEYCKRTRTMSGHTGRVGALAWNNHILSTGSRDRTILHRDTRVPEHYIRRLAGHHKQEVCGLRWNEADQLASGGNDNKLFIWDGVGSRPTWRFGEHRAAVKAIAWSPHQRGILASGGGTADKKIRFWNSQTGGLISEQDTGSQVCNLMWSKNSNEIVSTHGYSGGPVQNQIHIWKYPSMTQIATLTGHTYRVLYLAMSPDGQTIVTGAGDETLRFWNAFERAKGEGGGRDGDDMGSGSGGGGFGGGNAFVKLR